MPNITASASALHQRFPIENSHAPYRKMIVDAVFRTREAFHLCYDFSKTRFIRIPDPSAWLGTPSPASVITLSLITCI
jgi:hypothetical protein